MRRATAGFIGLTTGIALGTGTAQRWGADIEAFAASPSGSTLLAGFGGVLVAGVISYVIAERGSQITLRRDEEARLNVEQAGASRAIITAQRLTNLAYNLQLIVDEARSRVAPNTPASELWSVITPTVMPENAAPQFVSEDFVPFIKAKAADVINDCIRLSDEVETLRACLARYNSLRGSWDAFAAEFSTPVQNPDGSFETTFQSEYASRAAMQAHILGDLVANFADRPARVVAQGKAVATKLSKVSKEYFGNRPGLTIVYDV